MKKISVLLADDHTVVREGLRSLLSAEPDIEVVGEADDGRQAVRRVQELRPTVAVIDIAMPLLNGLEATRQINHEGLPTRVLILSSYSDDEYMHQLTEAGASGYLIKQTAAADLIKAIRETAKGNAFFSPSISRQLLERYREANAKGRPARRLSDELTGREMEVLQLVAEGHVNKQIAAALCLSIKTIEKHRQKLMHKLNIHDVVGLTRYAISHRIVENPLQPERTTPVNVAPEPDPAPAPARSPEPQASVAVQA